MENNTQPVTAQELSNVAMHPRTGFPSEEAMKADVFHWKLTIS